MKDFRGLDIREGDLITYPCRAASRLWMNLAQVEAVMKGKLKVVKPTGICTYIVCSDRVAVLGRNE